MKLLEIFKSENNIQLDKKTLVILRWIAIVGQLITINVAKAITLSLIKFYKRCISPFLPVSCRHMPTCSEYAYIAIDKHGVTKGMFLSIKRISKCHPWGKSGHDPVPD